jgi:hypothetical protein
MQPITSIIQEKISQKEKNLGPTSKVTLDMPLVTRDYQRKISQITLAGN